MKIEYEFKGCCDCPFIRQGFSCGSGGYQDDLVYFCLKGTFGKEKGWGNAPEGKLQIPITPPDGCPYFKAI